MEKIFSLNELFQLTIQTFTVDEHHYAETTLKVFVQFSLLIQFLAWNNCAAYLENVGMVQCSNWKDIPNDVIKEIRETLFTCYKGFISNKQKYFSEKDKCYVFKAGDTNQISNGSGYIGLPSQSYIDMEKTNIKLFQYP
jgi:hypothetical protein